MIQMTNSEFELFRQYIYEQAGINLTTAKKIMVGSRLSKRLIHYNLNNFHDYFKLATNINDPTENQIMLDLITTNETYFFREPKHFDYFTQNILTKWDKGHFRVWSAASSSGEEAYSLAMLLADKAGLKTWDILGTDLNCNVLRQATEAVYPLERTELLTQHFLQKYCLKGVRSQEGSFKINNKVSQYVNFKQLNLMKELPNNMGNFDVIFLRNVLIYFDEPTKKRVVEKIISKLRKGGHFFISHSETLARITDKLQMIQPSIYVKK